MRRFHSAAHCVVHFSLEFNFPLFPSNRSLHTNGDFGAKCFSIAVRSGQQQTLLPRPQSVDTWTQQILHFIHKCQRRQHAIRLFLISQSHSMLKIKIEQTAYAALITFRRMARNGKCRYFIWQGTNIAHNLYFIAAANHLSTITTGIKVSRATARQSGHANGHHMPDLHASSLSETIWRLQIDWMYAAWQSPGLASERGTLQSTKIGDACCAVNGDAEVLVAKNLNA